MRCSKVRKKFTEYLHNSLSLHEKQEIQSHISGCDTCSTEFAQFSKVWNSLDLLAEIEPSEDFRLKLKKRIRREKETAPLYNFIRQLIRPIPATVIALILLGIYSTYYYYSRTPLLSPQDFAISSNLDMLIDFELIDNLELIENYESIEKVNI